MYFYLSALFGVTLRLCTLLCACTHVLTRNACSVLLLAVPGDTELQQPPLFGLLVLATPNISLVDIFRQSLKLRVHYS